MSAATLMLSLCLHDVYKEKFISVQRVLRADLNLGPPEYKPTTT
jgi:hypothetical protein